MGRLRHLVIRVCILATFLAMTAHSQTRQPNATLDAGVLDLNKGNVFEAIRIFKQIVRAEPSSPALPSICRASTQEWDVTAPPTAI
jgi:hypothetical protein